jgi:hypothetical protein
MKTAEVHLREAMEEHLQTEHCASTQQEPAEELTGATQEDGPDWLADAGELARLGTMLDDRPSSLGGRTVAMALIEDLLRVRVRDGSTRPLIANAVQHEFERRRGEKNIVLKARQLGLTTWTAARFFLRTITRPGTLTLQVAHTQQAAEEIFRIVHRFVDWLPAELREGPLKTSQLNARQIVFPEIDAQYCVVTAGDRNAGRGLTVQNLHCSELARWPGDPGEILAGLRASLAPGAEVVLESTPQGVGGCFYEEWQKAHETGTVRHFFPWWMEPAYCVAPVDPETLSEEERSLMERVPLTLGQIGFRRQIRAGLATLAPQEYAENAESCFLASGECFFDLTAIEDRMKLAPQASAEHRYNDAMEIWLPAAKKRKYVVAVDPAGGGSGGDYSAIEVVDRETGMQCAEFAGHVGGLELARLAAEIAREYNDAWLVVERNNHGSGVLAYLEVVCRYERVFRQDGQAGWLTNSVTRPAALARLGAALAEKPECLLSRRLLAECRSFVRLPDGRTGAQPGAHDDRVMAMAIALAARMELAGRCRD